MDHVPMQQVRVSLPPRKPSHGGKKPVAGQVILNGAGGIAKNSIRIKDGITTLTLVVIEARKGSRIGSFIDGLTCSELQLTYHKQAAVGTWSQRWRGRNWLMRGRTTCSESRSGKIASGADRGKREHGFSWAKAA